MSRQYLRCSFWLINHNSQYEILHDHLRSDLISFSETLLRFRDTKGNNCCIERLQFFLY